MTDIVERLRNGPRHEAPALCMEAADEIERLRAAFATCRELRVLDAKYIEWLRATVNRVIENLEAVVFCDGHTRAMPCEPECHCVQHYDAVRELIR